METLAIVIDVAVTPTSVAPPLPPAGAALLDAPVVPAPLPPAVVPPPVPPLVPAAPARSPVLPLPVVSRPVDPPPEPPVPPPPPGPPTRRASPTWALCAREPHPAARSASRVRMTTVAAHRR